MTEVKHDAAARRFTTTVDGQLAVLDYALSGGIMTITHTGVPDAIGGRGIAAELMHAALSAARTAHWKVVPVCSYAAAYMNKHSEAGAKQHQDDLLDEALDETFPASDPRSVGGSS
jgi:uncharacterized protein